MLKKQQQKGDHPMKKLIITLAIALIPALALADWTTVQKTRYGDMYVTTITDEGKVKMNYMQKVPGGYVDTDLNGNMNYIQVIGDDDQNRDDDRD
jgi:hypothetical protein